MIGSLRGTVLEHSPAGEAILEVGFERGEPLRQRRVGRGAHDPARHGREVMALAAHRAVPAGREARVDAEDRPLRIEHVFDATRACRNDGG